MFHVKFSLLIILFVQSICVSGEQRPITTGFIDQSLIINEHLVDYQIYLPKNYEEKKKWPIILFLHGAGERGKNNFLATEVGLGRAIRHQPNKFPAISIFPQCSNGEWWSSPQCEEVALNSLYDVISRYSIDEERIYLTGISMGGYGTWHLASKRPELWSALYVISGRVKPGGGHPPAADSIAENYEGNELYKMTAKVVAHIPIWIAHGENDEVVPVSESRQMYKYLQKEDAQVNYTEYSQTWHNAWDKAYSNDDAISWMFSRSQNEGDVFAIDK